MTPQEAIRLLDPATTRDALWEIEYYGGFSGKEAQIAAIEEACIMAVEALKRMSSGKWIEDTSVRTKPPLTVYKCSVCGYMRFFNKQIKTDRYAYCPMCGVKMEGEV